MGLSFEKQKINFNCKLVLNLATLKGKWDDSNHLTTRQVGKKKESRWEARRLLSFSSSDYCHVKARLVSSVQLAFISV